MNTIDKKTRDIIRRAIEEDIGSGDITTDAIFKKWVKGSAIIIAKENFIVAGIPVVREVFKQLDKDIVFKPFVKDGERVRRGVSIAGVKGKVSSLLKGERTALNFLQHLSGIATLTRQFVDKVKGCDAKILDTRKTTPNLRMLEKYAVRCGGGFNHRFGLYDAILIKDNHIIAAGSIKNAVLQVRKNAPQKKPAPSCFKKGIEVEVRNLKELKEAIESRVDIIMLDNMKPSQMKRAVFIIRHFPFPTPPFPLIEASGGVDLKNVRAIAKTGVDWISIGALTHSAKAVDISMEIKRKL